MGTPVDLGGIVWPMLAPVWSSKVEQLRERDPKQGPKAVQKRAKAKTEDGNGVRSER